MHTIIAYDIADDKIRTKISKLLLELGIRSQYSVFECDLTTEQMERIRKHADGILDHDTDSLLIFPLCKRCEQNAKVIGLGIKIVKTDWTII